MSTPVLLVVPRTGIPGSGLQPGDYVLARVPIYGTRDAGRGLWRRMYRVFTLDGGMRENFIFPALYHIAVDGVVKLMLGSHVDDILWARTPDHQHIMDKICH